MKDPAVLFKDNSTPIQTSKKIMNNAVDILLLLAVDSLSTLLCSYFVKPGVQQCLDQEILKTRMT